ncbi:DUF1707 SHOCT-like domain-containing protein [Pseudonocardia abyssalis]|uniref:DUF1707 SHOCT-like domain-containing protein n=1 Tax=Pseudonocardia abyssalis TaxID=2792008 RepID=UPI0027E2A505|nr:DUF1707 domain-containing protein [Pseudonocardia abyssalis]
MTADPAVRVGDTERRAADERLQRALGGCRLALSGYEERSGGVWATRTRADLHALTADLPAPAPVLREPVAADRASDTASRARRAGVLLGTPVVGAAVLWGGGQLLGRDDGAAVFSSRTIPVAAGDDRVELGFLFSSAEVVVPDDARDAACAGTGTGPEITVDASGAFGNVDVRTQTEASAADRDDDDNDDNDNEDDEDDDD